ncbi:hypothetical protein N7478_005559 [Penicillium angulare]|uniref:uncharacterized protein n=1 Tax=Penicillium angulare TaxID=116970 RepID=UPI0025425551|nr:uncharacterized protein N7478_005559 [Penicillium angulare]KAJ5280187.1 hypothetical protein N7478_005559 [Penicillium angulare]
MSTDLPLPTTALHSNVSQGHEIITSSHSSSVPLTSRRFNSLPSHRRANTEYIARPPIFEEDLEDSYENQTIRSTTPSWTGTFPKKNIEARARILSDWFQGNSKPVDLGIKIRPGNETDMSATESPRSTATSHSRKASTTTATGRFNTLFGLRRQAEQKPVPPEPADDEFLNLDIDAALSMQTADANSDDALDILREQASDVLQRMQEAYKQRTFIMHQAMADRTARLEELGETRARVDHLKTQLDGMAAKVMSQEKAMQAMAEELEEERRLRQQEENRNRNRTIRSIPADEDIPSMALQTPHRGGKRASHGTFTSDSGFESGDESVADSIFSHREGVESPTSTLTAPSPNLSQVVLSTPTVGPTPTPTIQKNLVAATNTPTPKGPSAYDRVMKGIASTRLGSSFVASPNSNQCKNCYGVPPHEAWSVMGVLKDENRGLKTRVGELELVVDDCLGLVGP